LQLGHFVGPAAGAAGVMTTDADELEGDAERGALAPRAPRAAGAGGGAAGRGAVPDRAAGALAAAGGVGAAAAGGVAGFAAACAVNACLQFGHRTCRPANSSGTWAGFWQCGHLVTRGIPRYLILCTMRR
jgi:hypothetical protein